MTTAPVSSRRPEAPLPPPEPVSPIVASLPAIPSAELGAATDDADWAELAMPDDARVLTFARDTPEGRETWTLAKAGAKRVLRIRVDDAKKRAQRHAAWVGTTKTKGTGVEVDLRLVEIVGLVPLRAERLSVSCSRDRVCEEGQPKHRAAAEMCTFSDSETGAAEVAFFAPGKGIDFVVGSCPVYESSAQQQRMQLRKYPMPARGF